MNMVKRYIVVAVALVFVALPMFAQGQFVDATNAASLKVAQLAPGYAAVSVGTNLTGPFGILLQDTRTNSFFGVKSPTGLAGFIMDRANTSVASSLNFRTAGVDTWIMGMGAYPGGGSNFQIGSNASPFLTLTTGTGNLTVTGSITAGSVIGAVYQDVAEWVPATEKLAPGTVVSLNPEAKNQVMPSSHAYDTMVAGVVSAQPGVILGHEGAGKEKIATTGRVKVMVDATKSPIRVGDLLVTSDEAGVAMKSQPMEINGRQFHQPGTILGKALEPMSSGRGEILVLLSLQ